MPRSAFGKGQAVTSRAAMKIYRCALVSLRQAPHSKRYSRDASH